MLSTVWVRSAYEVVGKCAVGLTTYVCTAAVPRYETNSTGLAAEIISGDFVRSCM